MKIHVRNIGFERGTAPNRDKAFLYGEYLVDEGLRELYQRLEKYYSDEEPNESHAVFAARSKALIDWCLERGYTRDEVNNAKRNIRRKL